MTTQDPKDQKDPITNEALEQMAEIVEDDTDSIGTDVPVD